MDLFLQAAIEEARKGLAAGGIPIGSVLVLDGKIIGRGHNQRVQHGSVIHHAEMNCLENAGTAKCVRVQTLRALFDAVAVPHVQRSRFAVQNPAGLVIGENMTFQGPEAYVRSQGVKVEILNDPTCIQLMRDFMPAAPGIVE